MSQPTSEQLLEAARKAERGGQLTTAERLCQQVLFAKPKDVQALVLAGSIAARQGQNAGAISLLRKALEVDANSYDASRWLAGLLMGGDDRAEALKHAQNAARLRPKDLDAIVLLGMVHLRFGESDQAVDSFQRAIQINPNSAGAHHNLGVAFQQDEQYKLAAQAFLKAISLSPNQLATYLHLGMVYIAENQPESAINCFKQALKIRPGLKSASDLLADAMFLAVHGENGEFHLRKALQASPDQSFPHALLASWLQEQGKFEEAELSIERSIQLQPTQGFAYYLLAHNRKLKEADRPLLQKLENLSTDKALHPTDLRYVHFALGKGYDDLKEYEAAIRALDLANGEQTIVDSALPATGAAKYAERARTFQRILSKQLIQNSDAVTVSSRQPIFIFGMPRSGTTLLEQIVSRHSQVGAGGELSYWRDNRKKVIDVGRESCRLEHLEEVANGYLELLSSTCPGKQFVTDKFPSNYVHLGLLHLAFPHATFIHARRHPVDTCLSIYMRPFFSTNEFGYTRQGIVSAYKLYLELMEHWRTVLPTGRFLEVDYEALVADPESMTRKIIEHCGLEWEDNCLSPEAGDRRVKTFSKWQVRQPVYQTSVARWKNYEPWLAHFRELL